MEGWKNGRMEGVKDRTQETTLAKEGMGGRKKGRKATKEEGWKGERKDERKEKNRKEGSKGVKE
jgi:hypothetical protein